jgi:hypothetical protein
MTAADVLVEALIDWGVEVIFGLPGDGINGIMESLRTREDKIRTQPKQFLEKGRLRRQSCSLVSSPETMKIWRVILS